MIMTPIGSPNSPDSKRDAMNITIELVKDAFRDLIKSFKDVYLKNRQLYLWNRVNIRIFKRMTDKNVLNASCR